MADNIPDLVEGDTPEHPATSDASEELLRSFNKVAELCVSHKATMCTLRNKEIYPHDEARIQGLIDAVHSSSEVIDEVYKLIVGLNNFYGSQ